MSVTPNKKKNTKPVGTEPKGEKKEVKGKSLQAYKSIRSFVRSGRSEKFDVFKKPMLAHLDDKPFDDPDWIFEIKWDGYRAVAEIQKKNIRLYSRNGLSFEQLYPEIITELKKLKVDVILDGEIVVINKDNKPDFQKLQNYGENKSLPIYYYVFDCLSYKGKDITNLPLIERKAFAEKVIPKNSIIKYSEHVKETGVDFFNHVTKMDLEGMIAKRADSKYIMGRRSQDWLKIKNHNTQETIIAGFTAPRGSRNRFGALILGVYKKSKLEYVGHTGTGFTDAVLEDLYQKLKPLIQTTSPFDKKISVNAPVTWVRPVLVCATKYTEITTEGIFRHPVFQGLRIDKSAKQTNHIDAVINKHGVSNNSARKNKTREKSDNMELTVNGHKLILTNQNKIYWPKEQITKGNVIDYYNSIYKYIIPYLKDRPQSLKRNPNGIEGESFYQKDAGNNSPKWIKTIPIYAESTHKEVDYILCNDKATLLYLNNLGCIEINPWNSRTKALDRPDYLVIDIDPSDKNTFDDVIDTARAVKEILDQAGAASYCKTSGATGLHVYVPLHAAYTYDHVRSFAEVIARLTQQQLPKVTTLERSLDQRKGRIYLDYLQNKKGQTLASVYSLRPVSGATVSTPLLWTEVKQGLHPANFTIHNIGKRLEKKGDLFHGTLKERTDLAKCIKNLSI